MRRGSQFLLVALTGPWLLTGAGHAAPELPVMAYQPGINPQAFLPISYQCPTGKNGVVEVVKMSSVGARIKVRVTFEGESATHASVQRAWRDKSFEGWHEFTNPRKKPDSDAERTILQTALTEAELGSHGDLHRRAGDEREVRRDPGAQPAASAATAGLIDDVGAHASPCLILPRRMQLRRLARRLYDAAPITIGRTPYASALRWDHTLAGSVDRASLRPSLADQTDQGCGAAHRGQRDRRDGAHRVR